ncbi:response regulator receiver domain [Vibrio owensii]|uniref:response regulator receiver domain n=1 Tax=Vibrio owensii TaxID=696485 RepID=UPI0003A5CA0A|nr:response regulator receiver domain [Vibrio owensii]
MSAFNQYCRDVVDEYVQTVLIIDDGAGLTNNTAITEPIDELVEPTGAFDPMAVAIEADEPQVIEPLEQNELITHPLNTLSLTNAFYERGIVAGLYQPQIQEGDPAVAFASKAMKVTATADVIILDWMLIDHDSTYSKEIVKQILQHDRKNGGRLRTIVVYTGETNLHQLRDDLWAYLGDESLDKSTEYQISSEHLNIVFYNKTDAMNEIRSVSEEELPEKALKEFSVLVNGLVPAFAMKATSTVRQYTGALLTKFSSDLDSGYLAHRALLPDPQDSEVLMLENYSSYLRNVLALAQIDRKTLGYDTLKVWVESNYDSRYKKAQITGDGTPCKEITISKEGFLKSLEHGFTEGKNGLFKAIQDQTSSKRAKKIVNVLANLERVVGAFGSSDGETRKSSQTLACVTAFRRTFRDLIVGFPYLTQGTVIKSIDDGTYLICVMPKCDTARVKKARNFLFSPLATSEGVFDLVAPDIDNEGKYIHLRTNLKFYELEHIEFKANGGPKVEAFKDKGKTVFKSEDNKKYLWIGDLEDLDVQTKVASIVGDFNRVGVDEIEFLRRRKAQTN